MREIGDGSEGEARDELEGEGEGGEPGKAGRVVALKELDAVAELVGEEGNEGWRSD